MEFTLIDIGVAMAALLGYLAYLAVERRRTQLVALGRRRAHRS